LAVHRTADPALQPLGLHVELARNFVVALAALEDDEVFEQPGPVFVERAYFDRVPRPAAGREKAMSVGDGARRDVLHLSGLCRRGASDCDWNAATGDTNH